MSTLTIPANPYRPHPDASAFTAARIVGDEIRAYTTVEPERGWQGIEHMLRTAWKVGRVTVADQSSYALLSVLDDDDAELHEWGIPTADAFRWWYRKLGWRVAT